MNTSHILFTLSLLGSLGLTPLTHAATPQAADVCAGLTKAAQKAGKKADAKAKAEAKGRLALAAAIRKLEKAPENVNEGSKGKGITPLMIATALGERDAVAWLISIGADPTIKDAEGRDSLARTEDEELTKLLKTGALFSWEEVFAYMENSQDNAYKHLLDACKKSAAHEEEPSHHIVIACGETDLKLTSFVLRQCTDDTLRLCRGRMNVGRLPAEKRIPMLNLLNSYKLVGIGAERPHDFNPDLRQDKAVHDWLLKHCNPIMLMRWCCIAGFPQLADAAIQKARAEAGQDPAMLRRIQTELAACMTVMGMPVEEEMMNFLLKQDRGGCISYWLLSNAAGRGDLSLLKQLLETEKTTSTVEFSGSEPRSIEGSLWILIGECFQHDEIYNYLKAKLEAYPPATPWGELEAELNEALGRILMAVEQAAGNGKPAAPRLLEMARILRRHGAQLAYRDRGNYWSHETLEQLKCEEMKKLLLETEGLSPRSIMITGAVIASRELFTAGLKQLQKQERDKEAVNQAIVQAICYAAHTQIGTKQPEYIDYLLQHIKGDYGVLNDLWIRSDLKATNPSLAAKLEEQTFLKRVAAGKAPSVLYMWDGNLRFLQDSCATFSPKEALFFHLLNVRDNERFDSISALFDSLDTTQGDDHGHLSCYLYTLVESAASQKRYVDYLKQKGEPVEPHYAEEYQRQLAAARLLLQHGATLTCEQGNCLYLENVPEEMRQLLLHPQGSKAGKKPDARPGKKQDKKPGRKKKQGK